MFDLSSVAIFSHIFYKTKILIDLSLNDDARHYLGICDLDSAWWACSGSIRKTKLMFACKIEVAVC